MTGHQLLAQVRNTAEEADRISQLILSAKWHVPSVAADALALLATPPKERDD